MRTAPRSAALLTVLAALLLTAVGGSWTPTASAQDSPFASLDAPGPDLTLTDQQLEQGLRCPDDLAAGDRAVLLVHGTGTDAATNWAWGYQPALEALGLRVCTVDLLANGLADAQLSAERVVYAVRTMHDLVGERIGTVGYSQGGGLLRFILRFWPDVRDRIYDLVLLGVAVNGTVGLEQFCATACAPAFQQFRQGSAFLAATNSLAVTFPGVDATSIATTEDAVVTPNDEGQASRLDGAANVLLQDVCPGNSSDHIELGLTDPVAYALAVDALLNDGPADPARLPPDLCREVSLPGISAEEAERRVVDAQRFTTNVYRDVRLATEEPPLRCYVTGTCGAGRTAGGASTGTGDDGDDDEPFAALQVGALVLLVVGLTLSGAAATRSILRARRRRA